MSRPRDEILQIAIFARTNSVTGENFGQAESYAKMSRESKSDLVAGHVAGIYLVVRESKYDGMITADYGYFMPDGIFKTDSIRFVLLDTFEMAPSPQPLLIQWRELPLGYVEAAYARLLKIGDFTNASLVAADVILAQARSLFPAIFIALEQHHLPTDVRVLNPGEGQKLHGQAAIYYGGVYTLGVPDRKMPDVKPNVTSVSLASSTVSLSTASTLFARSVSSSSAAPVAVSMPVEVDAVPKNFSCPISSVIMRNPVIAADGHNYEESYIREWIGECKRQGQVIRSPMDNQKVIKDLFPNMELRDRIHESVLASSVLAREFWESHKEAILYPKHELDEVDFSIKFQKKYPGLISEAAPEGPQHGPGSY